MTTATNWAGNHTYRATRLYEPETVDELRRIVASAPKVHALGSRHSFNDIGDSTELVSLANMPADVEIDRDAGTVTVGGGVTYGHLAQALEHEGLALHNMASLPHISVAGAVATATHGSGDRSGNLATAVVGLELVQSSGDMLRASGGDPDFPGMVVNLGALGVVHRLTLRVEPSYRVRQQVFERLDWDVALERFDQVMAGADSVSLFTDYGATVNQVWRKQRVAEDENDALPGELYGAPAATVPRHPVASLSAESCTGQLGIPGPWLDRLPHFRMAHTPASGAEIQSEYFVPRRHAVAALQAMRECADAIRPPLMISEIRTIAADELWLSTAYGRDTVGIHLSWNLEPARVARALPKVEAALAPFEARPHWGKSFARSGVELAARYERLPDFRRLAERLDPRGAFRNAFLDRCLFA